MTEAAVAFSIAVTATVRAISQFSALKVNVDGLTDRSVPEWPLTVTVTGPVGLLSNTTVYWLLSPAKTVSIVGVIVTPAASSSVMATVDSAVSPAVTPSGSVPKVSFTDSPSSSTSSASAPNVNSFSVSPELKVRLAGTPE